MPTEVYLRQLPSWFGQGPMIVGFVYMVVGIGIWTAFWQLMHNSKSGRFFARKNAVWVGFVVAVVGSAVFVVFAGPALIEAFRPLLTRAVCISTLVFAALLAAAYGLIRWVKSHP